MAGAETEGSPHELPSGSRKRKLERARIFELAKPIIDILLPTRPYCLMPLLKYSNMSLWEPFLHKLTHTHTPPPKHTHKLETWKIKKSMYWTMV